MTLHYFSVAEANALLPELQPLMAELLKRRARAARRAQQLGGLLEDLQSDIGGPWAAELSAHFVIIEDLTQQIRSMGCIIKNLNAGLVDFLAQIDGRDVYLCWKFGEKKVGFYHELHTGFRGRRRIE